MKIKYETFEVLADPTHLMLTLEVALKKAEKYTEEAERIKWSIIQQIQANGGTELPSEEFICALVVKNTYDISKFVPLLEELNETEMKHAWEEEWTEAKIHPGKFNTTKLKAICNKRGGKAKQLFENALIPGNPTLEFKKR